MNLLSAQRRALPRRKFLSPWIKDWLAALGGVVLLIMLAVALGSFRDGLSSRGEFHPQLIVTGR